MDRHVWGVLFGEGGEWEVAVVMCGLSLLSGSDVLVGKEEVVEI